MTGDRWRTAWTLMAVGVSVPAWAGTPAFTVAGINGAATMHGAPLKSGDAITAGETIAVAPDATLKLQMADQSVILAAGGTTFTVTRYDTGAERVVRLTLAEGLLRLTIPAASGASSVEVATATSVASMRSTSGDWFMANKAGAAQVGTLAGNVALTSTPTGQSVAVPAHWGSRLEPGLSPTLPRAWASVEFDGFIRRTACCQAPQSAAKP